MIADYLKFKQVKTSCNSSPWDVKGVLKSKTVKREIFFPVKELVLIDKYTPSIIFGSLSLFLLMFIEIALQSFLLVLQ